MAKEVPLLTALALFCATVSAIAAGCIPNEIAVNRDGTIALCLDGDGEYKFIPGDEARDIYITDGAGSFLKRLTTDGKQKLWPHWSPDGKRLVYVRNDGSGMWSIVVVDAGTREEKALHTESANMVWTARWAPDGKSIAYTVAEKDKLCRVKVIRVESGKVTAGPQDRLAWFCCWSAKRNQLICIEGSELDNDVVVGELKTIQPGEMKGEGLAAGFFHPYSLLAESPDGRTVAFSAIPCASPASKESRRDFDGESGIYRLDASAGRLSRLSSPDKFGFFPAFSPDGKMISWLESSKEMDDGDVWIETIESGEKKVLVAQGNASYPFWISAEKLGFFAKSQAGDVLFVKDVKTGETTNLSDLINARFKELGGQEEAKEGKRED
ncbi:MAG: hypothetical protein RDV41_01650 [Planctomycetota bacterium]|nr:hypothetical protein [Planctomycetota bacterium]